MSYDQHGNTFDVTIREESKGLEEDYNEANQNSIVSKSQRVNVEPLNPDPVMPSSSIVQLPADFGIKRTTEFLTS